MTRLGAILAVPCITVATRAADFEPVGAKPSARWAGVRR